MAADNGRDERIRQQAFLLWNAEGRPEGKEKEHWRRAEQTVDEMDRLAAEERRRGEL